MAIDLSRVGVREKLKNQREPYWQRIRVGCFLGYRPAKNGRKGTWISRVRDPDSGQYRFKSLGGFGTLGGNEAFAAAKKDAELHAEQVESGGALERKIETVKDACSDYAETRPEAEQRFRRYVYGDPIAAVKLERLRRRHLKEWRSRLKNTPALASRKKEGKPELRTRADSTVNRDMAALRAALSKVLAPGTPNTEAAWQEALKATPNADGKRNLYLDRNERKRLLEHCDQEIAPFVRALCLLPLRPGALAALSVGDFDGRTSELTIGKDKAGIARRIKLPANATELFDQQAISKLPKAPLFMRNNGLAWDKNSWKRPIAAAVKAANLPSGATAYTLRHSTITDLVGAALPLLTIAQISGTSAEMIERHYGHLVNDAAVDALSDLAI